jgi:uncharacterized protein involved in exopolysaccharide biosynthesis
VIRKVLEAVFQHKLLLILPAILIPAIVTPVAIRLTPPVYETSVSIWIDRPAYLNLKDTSNPWNSPVETQSSRLNDLLHTRAFVDDVAQRTSLAPLAGTPSGEQALGDLVARGVTVGGPAAAGGATTASQHLLVVHVQAPSAQVSYEMAGAIVDAYQEKTAADQADQASIGVDFFQQQLQDAQTQLNKANQDLRRYVSAQQADGSLPSQSADPNQSTLPAAMLDPKLGTLQANVQAAQALVNNAQTALNQAQQDAAAAAQGQDYGFQVLDPAVMPTAPTVQTKKIMIYPIAAAVVGLGLSGMLLVLFVASDRSVRAEQDVTANGLRVLGSVPALRVKRPPKNLKLAATRRAIGAAAGTALPAPGGAH